MKNFASKGAVLAAVAAACGYASAATVGPSAYVTAGLSATSRVSAEGAAAAAVNTALPANKAFVFAVTVTTTVSHFAGDEWRLTLSNGTWSATSITPSVACGATSPITLDQVPTISGNTLTYTVGAVSGTTSGVECTFNSLAVGASSLTAGDVIVTFGAKRASSTVYDRDLGATATNEVFSVRSQLGAIEVQSAFNGVVDYQGSAGKGFATDDGSVTSSGNEDQLVLKLNTGAVADTAFSLGGSFSLNVVINAESGKKFAFLDANNDGVCAVDEWATTTHSGVVGPATLGSSNFTINGACTQLTFVKSDQVIPGVGGATTFAMAAGSRFATPSVGTVGNTITPMDFPATSTAVFTRGANTLIASTTFDAGAWTSNGSTVVILYMPANTTAGTAKIQPVIYVTNRSDVSGPATATMRNESGVSCTADLGTINANRTVNVSTAITNAIATCYNTSDAATAAGHRLNIVITASLPSATTEVYSGFTVGGSSRVSVVNSSNGK